MSDSMDPIPEANPLAPSLSWEQRMALVRAFQDKALRRPDPLAANLGVLSADLMGFAHGLAPAMHAQLLQALTAGEAPQRFVQQSELYLKIMRQLDRLAQLERQLSPPAPSEPRRSQLPPAESRG